MSQVHSHTLYKLQDTKPVYSTSAINPQVPISKAIGSALHLPCQSVGARRSPPEILRTSARHPAMHTVFDAHIWACSIWWAHSIWCPYMGTQYLMPIYGHAVCLWARSIWCPYMACSMEDWWQTDVSMSIYGHALYLHDETRGEAGEAGRTSSFIHLKICETGHSA